MSILSFYLGFFSFCLISHLKCPKRNVSFKTHPKKKEKEKKRPNDGKVEQILLEQLWYFLVHHGETLWGIDNPLVYI